MTISELYEMIKERFLAVPGVNELLDLPVKVTADTDPEKTLLPEGAVPSAAKRGEYRVCASLSGTTGEAYTETPWSFEGTLCEALQIPVTDKGINAISIACINAALSRLGLIEGTFSETIAAHESYADSLCRYVVENYGKKNIILVGYDGYIVKRFMDEGIDFWTMDRDPDNIAQDRFNHVIVNSAKYNRESCFAWGKLFIITGSTLCNGTVVQYLDKGKNLLFYGVTGRGASHLLGWKNY